MMKYDLLVYLGLFGIFVVIAVAALVLARTPENIDLEARKIRFAAATFTGILMLFVFTAILYFVDATGAGKEIFDKAFAAMSPVAGAIIGYLFASRGGAGQNSR